MTRQKPSVWVPRVLLVLALLGSLGWQGFAAFYGHTTRGTAWFGSWDVNFYFMWGRSIAVDGDIDFENDIQYIISKPGLGPTRAKFARFLTDDPYTEIGRIKNKFAMGLGVLSLPSLWALHWAAGMLGEADPFAARYFVAFICTSILAAGIGLTAAFRLLTPEYGRRIATIAVGCGVLGLSLGYYVLFLPGMAHAAGFGCVTLYLFAAVYWLRRVNRYVHGLEEKNPAWPALAMGFLLGVSALVRFPNAIYAVVPLTLLLATWHRQKYTQTRCWIRAGGSSLGVASVGAVAGFAPQLIAWDLLYGSMLTYSYAGETLSWLPWNAVAVLIGSNSSLFLWTPLALPAVVGLVLGVRRGHVLSTAGVLALLATLWIYGGWHYFTLGHSYGMRGFVDISFFFMLGLAELWATLATHRSRAVGWVGRTLLCALVCWNLYFVVCFRAQIQTSHGSFAGMELFRHGDRWFEQLARDTGIRYLRSR